MTATQKFFIGFTNYLAQRTVPELARDFLHYQVATMAREGHSVQENNESVHPPLSLKVRDHKEMKLVCRSVHAYIESLGFLRIAVDPEAAGRVYYLPVDEQLGFPPVVLVILPEQSTGFPIHRIHYYGMNQKVIEISHLIGEHLVAHDARRVAEVQAEEKAKEKAAMAQPWLDGLRTSVALMMECGLSIVSEQPADGPQHPDLLTVNQQVPQGDLPPSPTGSYYVDPKFMPQPIQGDSNAQ